MAEVTGLNAMMRRYLGEARDWILGMVGDIGDGDETEEEDELAGERGLIENGNRNGGNARSSHPLI